VQAKVRAHGRAHSALTRRGMDVLAKVEQLWAGERSLEELQRGLPQDASRLIELILYAEDDVFDADVARDLHDDEPHNTGDADSARRFFDSNIVHVVRIRQLADPTRAMEVQPRFNQNGVEDERSVVREHYCPTWAQFGWDVAKPIERLWVGERNLEVLTRGCDPGVSALVGMLLTADDEHAEEATRCGQPPFLSHFYTKTIILPRQALDKHREKLRSKAVSAGAIVNGVAVVEVEEAISQRQSGARGGCSSATRCLSAGSDSLRTQSGRGSSSLASTRMEWRQSGGRSAIVYSHSLWALAGCYRSRWSVSGQASATSRDSKRAAIPPPRRWWR
jgi:hypothetical protein